jgi:CRISPR-associated protein Cas2
MRRRYLVAYDVADPKRLRQTYRAMHGFGDAIQYSVFVCDLSQTEKQQMVERLTQLLNLKHDRVLIADLGETADGTRSAIHVLGAPLTLKDDYSPVIV